MRRWAVVLVLACGLVGVGWAVPRPRYGRPDPPPAAFPELLVTAEWLRDHAADGGVTIVDARPAADFAAGHVAGAANLDAEAGATDPRTLGARLGAAGIPDGGTVVCYGDARDPVAAGRLFWLLELAGHRDARVLNGGLEAWRAAGGEVASGAGAAPARDFRAPPDTSRLADFAYVSAVFGTPGHTVVDWRTDAAWRAGHIPHSLPFPLADLIGSDGRLLDGRRMRPVFEAFGPRANESVPLDDEFVVCGDLPRGGAAVHPYLAARLAGIARVRCYPGGSADWRAHTAAPVVRVVGVEDVRRRLTGPPWRRVPRDAVVFDLREPREFRAGHLPGAVLLPPLRFAKDLAAEVARHWPHADPARTPLVVYCYGPGCTRSRHCATLAARAGWRDLWWFRGGTDAWRVARLPLERER